MQFTTETATPTGIAPMTVSLTLKTADDVRWFYHLMNFQNKEIAAGYNASSKGSFRDRFQDFQLPDKKALFKAVKAHAANNNVTL